MKKIYLLVLCVCACACSVIAQTTQTYKSKATGIHHQSNAMTEEELNSFLRNNYERYPKKSVPPVQRRKGEGKKDEAVKTTLSK